MNIIYLGTPEFAVLPLEKLLSCSWVKVVAVVTQTDKEAGRGKKIQEPPVKKIALEKNILVFQCKKISQETNLLEKLKELKPDIMVTCAFGQILNQEVLNIAPVINVHASLLPKYRGAAPINWAILNGEKETGISIMKTELGLDTGPVMLQEKCEISENETSFELTQKLSALGADALIKALELIKNNKANFTPQDNSKATKAPMLKKELGLISWSDSAMNIHNKVRGLQPWPSAYTHYQGKTLKIWESKTDTPTHLGTCAPGHLIEISDHIKVQTGNGVLEIHKVQPENKKVMPAKDWANGARVTAGSNFE